MNQFILTMYSKAFIDTLDREKFPMTVTMCEKNKYDSIGKTVMLHLQLRYGKIMSVAILHPDEIDDNIHIYSFEVTSDCRRLGYGTSAINELKRTYSCIDLSSLNESRVFYEKMGFMSVCSSTFIWNSNRPDLFEK